MDVRRDLQGKERVAFRYRDKGAMATIGRRAAVARVGRMETSGFLAWMMWWMVHIAFLIGFRSRVLVMFSWAWSYFTFRRGARLITGPVFPGSDQDRSAESNQAQPPPLPSLRALPPIDSSNRGTPAAR